MGRIVSTLVALLLFLAPVCSATFPNKSYVGIVESMFGGTVGQRAAGSLRIVEGIATGNLDGSEVVVVASAFEWGVSIFTYSGKLVENWGVPANDGTGTNINIADVAVDLSGNIYGSDYRGGRILVFSRTGKLLRTFAQPGSRIGELSYPIGLKIVGDKLYVVEHGNNRIQIFRLDGKPIGLFGSAGRGPGQFDGAYDIAADSNGNLYVTDRENKRVQKFDSTGRLLALWGGEGIDNDPDSGPFQYIHEVAVDAKNRIYITDLRSDAIRVFNSSGKYLATLWLHSPKGIAIAPDQSIFVGTWDGHRVYRLRSLDGHLRNPQTCVTAICP